MATEKVDLKFEQDGLKELAHIAAEANTRAENIGARRLHTVMEKLLEEISFDAPECSGTEVKVDAAFVKSTLDDFYTKEDLSQYIL